MKLLTTFTSMNILGGFSCYDTSTELWVIATPSLESDFFLYAFDIHSGKVVINATKT